MWLRNLLAVFCVMVFGFGNAHAQKATERYIPIGKSPGLSGKYTTVGTISAVDLENGMITMTDPSGHVYSVKVTKQTLIWLDRSKLRVTNLEGTPEDCRAGVRIEVRHENDDRTRPAEWIKVEVTTSAQDG
jgi:hypothetical protein